MFLLASKNLKIKVQKFITLSVVLHWCETWFPILREGHRLKVSENRAPRRTAGTKRLEVTVDWRKLQIEKYRTLHSSPLSRVIK
jgi:hypothetical protein